MNNLFNTINIIKKKRRKEKELFHNAKLYLKSGLYFFEDAGFSLFSFRSFNLHRFFHLYFNLYNTRTRFDFLSKSKYAEYKYGFAKDLFLYEKHAVGFFKKVEFYEKAKMNYQNYYSGFPYSVVNVIGFDDERKTIVMEKVNGVQYDDKEHDQLVVDKLFEYALESPIYKSKSYGITHLQHGDAKRNNVLWINASNFVFIDIDNISYRPLLFDVLHYCAMAGMNLDEILSILDLHKSSIKKMFFRCDYCFDENYLDFIFYNYVLFFVRLGDCFDDVAFLSERDISSFPNTNKLISNID